MTIKTLDHVNVENKTVMVRVDFNVPMKNGKVADATRIVESLPTLLEIHKKGAKVILISHLGRPKGKPDPAFSLQPVAEELKRHMKGVSIHFEMLEHYTSQGSGDITLFENIRFYPGEEQDDDTFAQKLASLADIYVNDAFSVSHRAHASVSAITRYLPSYTGRLLEKELTTLEAALTHPTRPLMAIVGGAKVSTKLGLLKNLASRVQILALGGGMANTFLHALGYVVGASLCEHDMAEEALNILEILKQNNCQIILPQDGAIAQNLQGVSTIVDISSVPEDQMILDVGPKTVNAMMDAIDQAKTLVWNGELGVTEVLPFDYATVTVARHVAARTKAEALKSIAGGGDTVAALKHAQCFNDFTYVSMAGGAFLEWLEGDVLPGIEALKDINEDR
jgi:phosphoglycerate kinase